MRGQLLRLLLYLSVLVVPTVIQAQQTLTLGPNTPSTNCPPEYTKGLRYLDWDHEKEDSDHENEALDLGRNRAHRDLFVEPQKDPCSKRNPFQRFPDWGNRRGIRSYEGDPLKVNVLGAGSGVGSFLSWDTTRCDIDNGKLSQALKDSLDSMTSLLEGPNSADSVKNYLEKEESLKLDELSKLETRAQFIKNLIDAKKNFQAKGEHK